jgi:uncharacterized protein (TIGR03118 family)
MRSLTTFLSRGPGRFLGENPLGIRGRGSRIKPRPVRLFLESLEARIVPINPTVLDPSLGVHTVVSGLVTPTTMTFLGANEFLVVEKNTGKIDHVINGVASPTRFDFGSGPVANLPVNNNSERGLLGITLSSDFASDRNVYLYWTESSTGAVSANVADTPVLGNRVDRFIWNAVSSTFTFDRNIVRLHSFQNDGNGGNPAQMQGNHNAGVIHFGPDGKLYIVIGDNGRRGWMQNLIDGSQGPGQTDENNGLVRGGPAPDDAHLTGVVLRLNPDGSTPTDNPFSDISHTLQAPLLNGANERPDATSSIGTGSFAAFVNQAMDTLTVIASFQGLSGATLPGGADISIGGPNDTGPAVLTLGDLPDGAVNGQFTTTLTAANFTPADGINTFQDAINAMLAGQAYFTIHTTQNPGGEIRGQIGPISTPMGNEADITANLHKIYAYGIRNTFGFAFDPVIGKLWLEENGDDSFDKISVVDAGANDGWIQSMGQPSSIGEYKLIETGHGARASYRGLQQDRWSPDNIANSPEEALSRMVMLPGAFYNAPQVATRYSVPEAGLGFLSGSVLGSQYENALFMGEARDFSTSGQEVYDGALMVFYPTANRTGLDFSGDPNVRADHVFANPDKFLLRSTLNGPDDTNILFGEGFGIGTDIVTGPDGNLYVVSETKGAVYQIFRKAEVAAFHQTNLVSDIADPPGGAPVVVDTNLKNPWGVALSPTSPFWISNQRTGVSTLYSSNADGSSATKNPLEVTVPARTDLVVGSRATNTILRFNQVTGAFIGTLVAPGSGGLQGPGGVALGPDGNLYVSSDMTNSILRYNAATGAFIDTFVPSGFAGLNKPSGLLFGPDGNLYVNSHGPASQSNSSSVLRFDGTTRAPLPAPGQTGATFVPAGSGGLDQASVGLVFGPDGNLYVNSHLTNSVLRFNGVTGEPMPAASQNGADFVPAGSGGLAQPSGLTFGPDGNLYVGAHDPSAGHGAVLRYNGTTGAPLPAQGQTGAFFVPIDSGGIRNPTALAFGPDGNLYVDSRAGSRVLRYDGKTGAPLPASGQADATFVPQGSGGLNAPNSLNFCGASKGSPTGQVFNGSSDFVIRTAGGVNGPARFITASLDGVIAGWSPNVPAAGSTQAFVAASVLGAVYTGLAIGSNSAESNFLYAANQSTGRIDIFDSNFNLVTLGPGGSFEDPNLPPGSPFRAFNVQNLGGTLYVAYDKVVTIGAVTDREHDGIVDAFDTDGHFLRRVVTGGVNAPWGLALAPDNFGPFSGALLVGNFGLGDGKINAYDPDTGAFLGNLTDDSGKPLAFERLWALTFGNGVTGGTDTLFFTAGINTEQDGLFGSIRFGSGQGAGGMAAAGDKAPAAPLNPPSPGTSPGGTMVDEPASLSPDLGPVARLLPEGGDLLAALVGSISTHLSTAPAALVEAAPAPASPDHPDQFSSPHQGQSNVFASAPSRHGADRGVDAGLDLAWTVQGVLLNSELPAS